MFPPPSSLWHSSALQAICQGFYFQQQHAGSVCHAGHRPRVLQLLGAPSGSSNLPWLMALDMHRPLARRGLWGVGLMAGAPAPSPRHSDQCRENGFAARPSHLTWALGAEQGLSQGHPLLHGRCQPPRSPGSPCCRRWGPPRTSCRGSPCLDLISLRRRSIVTSTPMSALFKAWLLSFLLRRILYLMMRHQRFYPDFTV